MCHQNPPAAATASRNHAHPGTNTGVNVSVIANAMKLTIARPGTSRWLTETFSSSGTCINTNGAANISTSGSRNMTVQWMLAEMYPPVSTPMSMDPWKHAVEKPRYVFCSSLGMCLVT